MNALNIDVTDPRLSHATWYWNDNVARLETYLPPRNTHGGTYIEAEFAEYDTFGTWRVKENGRIIAEGQVRRRNDDWMGRSPQDMAEHIIVHGRCLAGHRK